MDALSPRDANVGITKTKTTASKLKPIMQGPPTKATANPKAPSTKGKDHPPPPPPEVTEPPSFDRKHGAVYKTGRCLGRGGFAICYEGSLPTQKDKFALKIVKSKMPQKKMEQKFQTELQIHSKMKHANIVNFHRAFTFDQATYIVLELCRNGSLMDMVKRRRFVTEAEVRYWTVQTAGAIKYMHGKGIIHRDLKMGNIFLDNDMNIKIGDFGLAAMLVSGKDMTTIRRTTLCGTPNYIAPEILEKGKKGHDHAVDIWSLGIIIFAMLTGKPPFQSDTQEEIYRRAREREYDWPSMDTAENFIGLEAKDLVATLLQDPDQRPDPDTIVQHPFFTAGFFPRPEDMTWQLREQDPDPKQFYLDGRSTSKVSTNAKNHKKTCQKSAVGPFGSTQMILSSTYREVAAEEKAGLTPQVPLPEDVVYRPFDEMVREGYLSRTMDEPYPIKLCTSPLLSQPPTRIVSGSARAPQSHAAQQRASHNPSGTLPSVKGLVVRRHLNQEHLFGEVAPISSNINDAVGSSTTMQKKMLKRENTVSSLAEAAKNSIAERQRKQAMLDQEERIHEDPLQAQARIGAEMARELNQANADRQTEDAMFAATELRLSLLAPYDRVEVFPQTRPDRVLAGVRRFHDELDRALKSRSMANVRAAPVVSPCLVIKWVDYTNKFGLGYILSNGSVGCIFTKQGVIQDGKAGYIAPSAIIVADAENHLQQRDSKDYVDCGQVVPVSTGRAVEFYENFGEEGIARTKVNPQRFAQEHDKDGAILGMCRGTDEFEERKRQKVVLWKKFANYMISYGRDVGYTAPAPTAVMESATNEADVIIFYQRFGDVGCWLFCDGHYQFNFPDHTKIILSADGTWCDFYHLPMEAALEISQHSRLPNHALDSRTKLSYPLQTLLNFTTKPSTARSRATVSRSTKPEIDPSLQGLPAANDLRRKIEFIKAIVAEWIVANGVGNGDMSVEGRLRWVGYRDARDAKKMKHVWTSVGARGGDRRKVAWFDPTRPGDVVPDIES